jgi:hypothetical protein
VVIGLFGVGELLLTMEEGLKFEGVKAKVNLSGVLSTLVQLPRYWAALIRGSLVGVWMGITPGGPTAASFMSYGLAKRFSKRRANFGKGEPEGVIAPETADHGAGTAAMLPMLALGIPGSATAAVMMGGLMIWGLNPGPMLFIERPDFVWGLIASMYLGNVVAVILVLATVPFFAAILRIPFAIIGPIIVVVCFIGAWTVGASKPDLWLALIFGVIGYVFKKLDYPDRAARAGPRARRQGRGRVPPVHADEPGILEHFRRQPAGRDHHAHRGRARDVAVLGHADRQGARRARRARDRRWRIEHRRVGPVPVVNAPLPTRRLTPSPMRGVIAATRDAETRGTPCRPPPESTSPPPTNFFTRCATASARSPSTGRRRATP